MAGKALCRWLHGGGSVWQLLAYISADQETKDRKQGQAIKPDLFPFVRFHILKVYSLQKQHCQLGIK